MTVLLLTQTSTAAPLMVVPEVAIYPCDADFSCVHVGDRRYVMNIDERKVGEVEILARSDEYVLARVPAIPDQPTLVLYQLSTQAIVAYGFKDDGLRHPTNEDLAEVVRDPKFLAYLTAPPDRESEPLEAMAQALEEIWVGSAKYRGVIDDDIDRLYAMKMFDSQIEGKFLRMMEVFFERWLVPNPFMVHRMFLALLWVIPRTQNKPTRATQRSNQVRAFENPIAEALIRPL